MVRKENQLNVDNIEVTGTHLVLLSGRGEIISPLFTHWPFSVEMSYPVLAATVQVGCQKMGCKSRDLEDTSTNNLGR